jgi:hypothetical protein
MMWVMVSAARRPKRQGGTHLEAEVRRRLANEAERRADVDFYDNVEGVVRGRMQHLVEGEARYGPHQLPAHPHRQLDRDSPLLMMWLIFPYFLQ